MNSRTVKFVTVPYFSMFVLMAVATMPTVAQTTTQAEDHAAMIHKRMDYFYQQRAYPLAHTPTGARQRAIDHLTAMPAAGAAKGQVAAAAAAAKASWTLLGPKRILPLQPYPFWGSPTDSGRVTALAVDPTAKDTVYLGAAEGGVWKSTDGGKNWSPLTDSQPSLAIGSIAIDPTNTSTIYVGTGEENNNSDAYYGAGILKSIDGGTNWTQLGTSQFKVCASGAGSLTSIFSGTYIGSIAVDPKNNQVLLAAVADYCGSFSGNGVYMSMDAGATWTNVLNGASSTNNGAPGSSVAFASSTTTSGTTTTITVTAYAALADDNGGNSATGIYTSSSTSPDGVTWSSWSAWTATNGTGTNVVPTGTSVARIVLAPAPSSPSTLYAVFANSSRGFLGLYLTKDGGTNWSKTNAPDYCSTQCDYNLALAVSPVNASVVYGAGIYNFNLDLPTTVIGSTDAGFTWTNVGSSTGKGTGKIHTDAHALAFSADGSRLFVGSDGGAWRTDTPNNPGNLDWTGLNDGLSTVQFYPGLVYDSSGNSLGGAQDNGSLSRDKSTGEWSNTQCGDGAYSVIDTTTTPSTLYASCIYGQGIYKSAAPPTFTSWTEIDGGINTSCPATPCNNDPSNFVPPMVNDPSHPTTLYFGTNQIYQTTNGGTTPWASISPQPLPSSTGNVSAIAVAPSNSNIVYAGTTDSQVVLGSATTNMSVTTWTWTNITSTGLPPRYITHITVDPAGPSNVYVTFSGFSGFGDTLGHIFQSAIGATGITWMDISGNLPNIPVNDLLYDPVLKALYAATDIGVFSAAAGSTTWSPFGTGLPNVAVLSLFLEPTGRTLVAATHGRAAWKLELPKSSASAAVSRRVQRTGRPTGTTALAKAASGR